MESRDAGREKPKRGFFRKLLDKLDKKLEEKAKSGKPKCCGGESGQTSCCK